MPSNSQCFVLFSVLHPVHRCLPTQECRFLSQEVREKRGFQFRLPRVFAPGLPSARHATTQDSEIYTP